MIAIGVCDPRGVMGKGGNLPWHFPEDLRFFSDTVAKYPLVMGYRTCVSLPDKYFDRLVFVFTRQIREAQRGEIFVHSIEEFLTLVKTIPLLYIIGGSEIFTLFLQNKLIDEFLLTEIYQPYEGDAFLPLSLFADWFRTVVRKNKDFIISQFIR